MSRLEKIRTWNSLLLEEAPEYRQQAAEIAVRTVWKCLGDSDIQKVVFNVFQDYDKRIYDAILR